MINSASFFGETVPKLLLLSSFGKVICTKSKECAPLGTKKEMICMI